MNALSFKEFLHREEERINEGVGAHEFEVANMYFGQYPNMKVRDIARHFGRSVGEVYRIIHRHGSPNRVRDNSDSVIALAASGMNARRIAELTGYTPRNVSYILQKRSLKEGN